MAKGDDNVWVKTEPSANGTYIVVIEHQDKVRPLSPMEALEYAGAVMAIAQRADYDAAMGRLLVNKLNLGMEHVAQTIGDMRAERPPIPERLTWPLVLTPGVNQKLTPFLTLGIAGEEEPLGQWTVWDARNHAVQVLETVEAADLDNGALRFLRGVLDLPEGTARAIIEDLANWRETRP